MTNVNKELKIPNTTEITVVIIHRMTDSMIPNTAMTVPMRNFTIYSGTLITLHSPLNSPLYAKKQNAEYACIHKVMAPTVKDTD